VDRRRRSERSSSCNLCQKMSVLESRKILRDSCESLFAFQFFETQNLQRCWEEGTSPKKIRTRPTIDASEANTKPSSPSRPALYYCS